MGIPALTPDVKTTRYVAKRNSLQATSQLRSSFTQQPPKSFSHFPTHQQTSKSPKHSTPNPSSQEAMAIDATWLLKMRYNSAIASYDTAQRQASLHELEDLLLEARLPLIYRLKAHVVLAVSSARGWSKREEHRLAAEQAFSEISALVSNSATVSNSEIALEEVEHGIEQGELASLRVALDAIADKQWPARKPKIKPAQGQTTEDQSSPAATLVAGVQDMSLGNTAPNQSRSDDMDMF